DRSSKKRATHGMFLARDRGKSMTAPLMSDLRAPLPCPAGSPGTGPSRRRARPRPILAALAAGAWLLAAQPEARAQIEFVSDPPQQAEVGSPYVYTMRAATGDDDDDDDDDGSSVSFDVEIAPGWLEFDDVDTLAGTPQPGDVGAHPVRVSASLGGDTATQSFTIDVVPSEDGPPPDDPPPDDPPPDDPPPDDPPPNDPPPDANSPPVFDGAPTIDAVVGEEIDIDVGQAFSDPDGDALSLTAIGLPSWLALAAARLAGVPPASAGGASFVVRIVATDDDGASAEGEVRIDVRAANLPPRLVGAIMPDPQAVAIG